MSFYGSTTSNGWSVVYKKAIEPDGSLLFPEKLTAEFLKQAQITMGSYMFANQYQNEVIPDEMRIFKPEWFNYYESLPQNLFTFIAIDPALSEADGSDFTGIVVVSIDPAGSRYVRYAKRHRLNPTELVDMVFHLNEQWKPMVIGIEEVAYQKALLFFICAEMKRRNTILPVTGIKAPTDRNKQARIRSLEPWFEWNRILLSRGLFDLESELLAFPRGAHDDVIDALAYIDYIAVVPTEEKKNGRPHPNSPEYERWYIEQISKQKRPERFDPE